MPMRVSQIAARVARGLLLTAALNVAGTASAQNPLPVPMQGLPAGEAVLPLNGKTLSLTMVHLDSRIVETPVPIQIVDGHSSDIVDISGVAANQLRLHAVAPGITTARVITSDGSVHTIEIIVEADTRELRAQLQRLFPGTSIDVVGIRDGVVLRGWVTEPAQLPQIVRIAEQYYTTVHNQLIVAGPSLVMLQVKVLEVQRSKMRELGFNFLAVGQQYMISNAVGGLAPLSGVTAPFGGPPTATINPAAFGTPEMQFAITGNSNTFQGFLKALQVNSMAKILAEPRLVTTSGRPARMQSGGQFPILVPQSLGSVSIEWRDFGVELEVVPIVLGNGRLRMDVAPSVSERDFTNSVNVNGFVVPGLTSRSVNTQVEMNYGQTLMIGGLISSRRLVNTQKVPFLGELPWIGAVFSRKQHTEAETELVILVTPEMAAPMDGCQVPPLGPGQHSSIPTDHELFLNGQLEVPRYGPDCPECQIGGGAAMMVPVSPGMAPGGQPIQRLEPMPAGGPVIPAVPDVVVPQGDPVSARQPKGTLVNPFHPKGQPQDNAAATASRNNQNRVIQASGNTAELPGAIVPLSLETRTR